MKLKHVITLFILSILFLNTKAQDIQTWINSSEKISADKLYLQTDREFYFFGDTLWFASYLVDGRTHKLLPEKCNLYVELVNKTEEITQSSIFPLENGVCPGYMAFSNYDVKEGTYLLRAYTDYLKNFGADSFFEKTIKLSETKNIAVPKDTAELVSGSSKIDIQFFPEGGFLIANQVNRIAFKAINEKGKAVDVSGKIMDESGRFVCSFSSVYKGMGEFYFIPTASPYNVEIEGHPEINVKLPESSTEGAKIAIARSNEEYVQFKIVTGEVAPALPYYIVFMHRGEGMFSMEVSEIVVNKAIQFEKEEFKEGINRVVLLDSDFNPLSERLLFADKTSDIELNISLNYKQFNNREKVELQIDSPLKDENATLSVAVVNEGALNAEGITQNIKSYLLIDSELKGPVPSPADFFTGNDSVSSETKLDLLMLTNGWKNYIWNNREKGDVSIQFEPRLGVTLTGRVLKQFGEKAFDTASVVLSIKSKNAADLYLAGSDENGSFEFKNIQFYDTATVFLQGKNHRGKTRTNLELDSLVYNFPVNKEETEPLNYFSNVPLSLYRLNYFNERSLREFYPDKNTRLIKQVEVTANKPEPPDGHNRIYGEPTYSLKTKYTDNSYSNIFEYISGKFAGVMILRKGRERNYIVQIRSALNFKDGILPPLYLLNGIPVDMDRLLLLKMPEVDKVEILKGNDATIYGSRGAGGVISVFTKRAELIDPATIIAPGTIVKRIKGFAPYCAFYSPRYTPENINSEVPDVRTTLYWNPSVTLINGRADLSFFTCDNNARYKIFVEGMSDNGKICLGSGEFAVSSEFEKHADSYSSSSK